MVAFNLDTSPAKAYVYNQGGTVSPFLARLACHLLYLADKHDITLIPTYIPTHLNKEVNYLSQGRLVPEWHLLPHMAQVAFELLGQLEVDLLAFLCINSCQHYKTLESPLPSWDISGELCISSCYISCPVFIQVCRRTCYRSNESSKFQLQFV